MTQSEPELEQNLIERLTGLGYEPVTIRNAADLTANLKTQLAILRTELENIEKKLFIV